MANRSSENLIFLNNIKWSIMDANDERCDEGIILFIT